MLKDIGASSGDILIGVPDTGEFAWEFKRVSGRVGSRVIPALYFTLKSKPLIDLKWTSKVANAKPCCSAEAASHKSFDGM